MSEKKEDTIAVQKNHINSKRVEEKNPYDMLRDSSSRKEEEVTSNEKESSRAGNRLEKNVRDDAKEENAIHMTLL